MKHFIIFLFLLLVYNMAVSQDIIVTYDNDTIKCEITRVTEEYVHFSVHDNSGILLMRSRLPLSAIKYYEKGMEETINTDVPVRKEELDQVLFEEFDPAVFRLAINGGFTYQFGGYESWPDAYQQQLRSLWGIGSELHYYPAESFAVGLKYSHVFTTANQEFDPQRYGISSIRDECIRFSYAALSLMYRNILYDDQIIQYFIAGGMIRYKTDGLLDGNAYYERGETFGVAFGVTYDFLLTESFGIGAGAEANIARLTELEANGAVFPVDFSLSRIDLTIGIRFLK